MLHTERGTYRARSYVIRTASEETYCEECGWPLYVGDRAYTTDLEAVPEVGCTATCAETRAWVNDQREAAR